ncbi:MAG: protein kinase, partial [bacterium]|nr:protein kinase [bacterium]
MKALGQGGMGQVWLGRDQELQKEVALKFLLPDPSQQSLNFFKEEVRILSQLKHPHLVEIYDYFDRAADCVAAEPGLSPSPNLLSPGFSMEYVAGKTLRDLALP